MGEYTDVKRKKMLKLLKWLDGLSGFTIGNGGNHQWVIKHISWTRPFPITFKHGTVSRVYIKELMKLVVATGACTKELFDEHIK